MAGRKRTLLEVAGLAGLLALAVFVLQWLEFRYLARLHSLEVATVLAALAFLAAGIWIGRASLARPSAGSPAGPNTAAQRAFDLTPRELAILEQLAEGLSNKQIARRLSISPNTVKTHIARILRKLGADNRTRAVTIAREFSLLP